MIILFKQDFDDDFKEEIKKEFLLKLENLKAILEHKNYNEKLQIFEFDYGALKFKVIVHYINNIENYQLNQLIFALET